MRFVNPGEKGIQLGANVLLAYYSLLSDMATEDSVKAINTFGNQAVNNRQGFVLESQQALSDTKLTRNSLKTQLRLADNKFLLSDKSLMSRVVDLSYKHRCVWSGPQNGAFSRCNLFKWV